MTPTVEEMTRRFDEIYRRKLYEITHPPQIEFTDLCDRIKDACRELGLPPIQVYEVDGNSMSYVPVDGIVREATLPFPTEREHDVDIAYVLKSPQQ